MPSDKRQGFLTDNDKEWLTSGKGGSDQKLALRVALSKVMEDIDYLLEQDIEDISNPSTDSLSELFSHVDSHEDIDREQCAENLITLAYIITNEPIDYTDIAENIMLHPRDESTSPYDSDLRPGSAMTPQPIEELLSFRRALTDGIKRGKSRVESDYPETVPNMILIDANTDLNKEPTKERLKPNKGGIDSDIPGFDIDNWGDAVAKWLDAYHPDSDPPDLTQSEAIEIMITEIKINIRYRLRQRRNLSDQPIKPNELPDN